MLEVLEKVNKFADLLTIKNSDVDNINKLPNLEYSLLNKLMKFTSEVPSHYMFTVLPKMMAFYKNTNSTNDSDNFLKEVLNLFFSELISTPENQVLVSALFADAYDQLENKDQNSTEFTDRLITKVNIILYNSYKIVIQRGEANETNRN